jgi:3-oxoadipate enol-lactonase
MPMIDVPGGRLNYRMDGTTRTDAKTLVLSNSLGTTLDMWDPQVAAFGEHFRLVRYDTRGHGASSNVNSSTTFAELAEDVVRLLDHLDVGSAHFLGLSMGGMTGMWLGAHRAARIERLVLCNTAALIGPASNWDARIAAATQSGVPSLAPAVIARWFTADFVARHPEAVKPIESMLLGADATGYVASCKALRDADLRADLAHIGAATLVVAGTHDPATTVADARALVAAISDARMLELDAAHLSNIEASVAFNVGVLEFLLGVRDG